MEGVRRSQQTLLPSSCSRIPTFLEMKPAFQSRARGHASNFHTQWRSHGCTTFLKQLQTVVEESQKSLLDGTI
ncbi:MAG: hypothetical protein JWP89_843 [Schlesneria sp.]|nr:hypothetical protein [Schlesneria sp.]